MRAGRLRHRVVIQNPTKTDAGGGNWTLTWPAALTTGTQAWADIEPLSASERFYSSGEQATVTHKVSFRYTTLITAESRFVYEGRIFYVQGPPLNPDGRKREITVTAIERAD